MGKFEVKGAKIIKLDNGNILFERTFSEELTPEEFKKWEGNTKSNYIALKNNVERLKAQINAEPILDDELKELSEKHKKAMTAAKILYEIDQAKEKLLTTEMQFAIAGAGIDALKFLEKEEDRVVTNK